MNETKQTGPKQIVDRIKSDLEYYADPDTYTAHPTTGMRKIDSDKGARARETLKEWQKT